MISLTRTAVFLVSAAVFAQVTPTAVTDAASFTGRIAPGSLATIFGSNIAVTTAYAGGIPLPTLLGGVQVTVDGIPAPLLFTGITPFDQINFQMPSEVQPGTASLVVTVNNVASQPLAVYVTPTAPGIFAYNATGANVDPTKLQSVALLPPGYDVTNSPSVPAEAGSIIEVYLDGIGAVESPVGDGSAAGGANPAVAASSATIGSETAPIQYLGLAPGYVGLGQANIQIPSDLPGGNYPLVLNIGGLRSISTNLTVSGSSTGPDFLQEVDFIGNFEVSQRTTTLLYNGALYLCGEARVRVFNIGTPSQPAFLGHYGELALNGHQYSCSLDPIVPAPFLASVVGPQNTPSLTVFDVSGANATAPLALVQGASLNGYTNVQRFVYDSNIGIANTNWIDSSGSKHGDILAFDFTNPANPVFVSALGSNTLQLKPFIRASHTVAHTVYALTGTGAGSSVGGVGAIDVIDTSNPQALAVVTEVQTPGTAILESFDVSGNTLLAAGNTSDMGTYTLPNTLFPGNLTLTTVDLSNPLSPAFITTVDTGIQSVGSLTTVDISNGGGVFAVEYQFPGSDINGPNTLAVVDARDASHPVFYPQSTYYYFGGISALNGYVYTATGNGLNTYQSVAAAQ